MLSYGVSQLPDRKSSGRKVLHELCDSPRAQMRPLRR